MTTPAHHSALIAPPWQLTGAETVTFITQVRDQHHDVEVRQAAGRLLDRYDTLTGLATMHDQGAVDPDKLHHVVEDMRQLADQVSDAALAAAAAEEAAIEQASARADQGYAEQFQQQATQLADTVYADQWYRMGVTARDAAAWANAGLTPSEAEEHITKGRTPQEILDAETAGAAETQPAEATPTQAPAETFYEFVVQSGGKEFADRVLNDRWAPPDDPNVVDFDEVQLGNLRAEWIDILDQRAWDADLEAWSKLGVNEDGAQEWDSWSFRPDDAREHLEAGRTAAEAAEHRRVEQARQTEAANAAWLRAQNALERISQHIDRQPEDSDAPFRHGPTDVGHDTAQEAGQ